MTGGRTDVTAAGFPSEDSPRLLLIEDDAGDALLVEELLTDGLPGARLEWVRSLTEADRSLAHALPDCVLLDLGLPDARGLEALARIHGISDQVPIVVTTGLDQERTGLAAVAAGAQDYLVKGRVEADLFGRAIRYAIQRKRAESLRTALVTSAIRAQENARLEHALLPTPLLGARGAIEVVSRYRPGRATALLGGDFFDVVADPTGAVHVVIGDVCGHGPGEAATGVALRMAWRTLTLSGVTATRRLEILEQVLLAERDGPYVFATVTSLTFQPDTRTVEVIRAGHPGMMVHTGGRIDWSEPPGGLPLGIMAGQARWPIHRFELAAGSALTVFTDGLFEGHAGPGRRLGEDGLLALARRHEILSPAAFLDRLIAEVEELAEPFGGVDDDVAVLHLSWAHPDRKQDSP